jgi:hypothetical protein
MRGANVVNMSLRSGEIHNKNRGEIKMKVVIPMGLVVMLIGLLAMSANMSIGAFLVGLSVFLFDRSMIEFEYEFNNGKQKRV